MGTTQVHVEPPSIPVDKVKCDGKSVKYFVEMKLRRDMTSSTSYPYEFNISLYYNGEPETFFLFVINFNMTIAESGTLEAAVKVQYIRTLVIREALRQFDSLSVDLEIVNLITVKNITKGLPLYFLTVDSLF